MQLFSGDTPLFLAPMAGVTDYAFRTVCAQHGADVTVTEMVSSRALVYQDRKSRGLLRRNEGSLCGAQIFGNDPAMMAEAAQIAVGISRCDFLDINMGCPMPKIANNGDGSALMRDIPLAGRIIRAVVDAVSVPVTVKTRLGWDRSCPSAVALARAAEENGAAAITVHGRTKAMLYSGRADWDAIGEVVRAVSIPVIANGDISDPEQLLRCRAHSGASLFMAGRAAFGDPWLFERLRAALRGKTPPELPPLADRVDTGSSGSGGVSFLPASPDTSSASVPDGITGSASIPVDFPGPGSIMSLSHHSSWPGLGLRPFFLSAVSDAAVFFPLGFSVGSLFIVHGF